MAAAWTVSDHVLLVLLRQYLASLPPSSWFTLGLYVNNHTPAPGDTSGDYVQPTPAQWPGYSPVMLPATAWATPSVVDNTATTNQPKTAVFTYPLAIASLTVYGYVVQDGYGNLCWAEEFATPVDVVYPGGISVQPYFNVGIQCDPSAEGMARLIGFAEDEEDGEEEG